MLPLQYLYFLDKIENSVFYSNNFAKEDSFVNFHHDHDSFSSYTCRIWKELCEMKE